MMRSLLAFGSAVALAAATAADPPDLDTHPEADDWRTRNRHLGAAHGIEAAWYLDAPPGDPAVVVGAGWRADRPGAPAKAELFVLVFSADKKFSRLLPVELPPAAAAAVGKLTRTPTSEPRKPVAADAPAGLQADLTKLAAAAVGVVRQEAEKAVRCDRAAVVGAGPPGVFLPAGDRWALLAWSARTGDGWLAHPAHLAAGRRPAAVRCELPREYLPGRLDGLEPVVRAEPFAHIVVGRRATALATKSEVWVRPVGPAAAVEPLVKPEFARQDGFVRVPVPALDAWQGGHPIRQEAGAVDPAGWAAALAFTFPEPGTRGGPRHEPWRDLGQDPWLGLIRPAPPVKQP